MRFEHPAQQIVLQDYIHAVQEAERRRDRLTRADPRAAAELVDGAGRRRRSRRCAASPSIVAVTVVAEVGDFRRFANPRQLMAYLGLVPSEHSSGSTVRRGGITKAGNALARRVLIEGAWTYRMSARVSRKLHDRLEPLPAAVRDIAWKAQVRLCARYRRLAADRQGRRSWSRPRSPARWSASSGRSPASPGPELTTADEAEPNRRPLQSEVRMAGGRATVGNPRALL